MKRSPWKMTAQADELTIELYQDIGSSDLFNEATSARDFADELKAAGRGPRRPAGDPIHHPSEIFADGQVTAGQFLQGSEAVLAMVDRAQISAAEQIGELARVNLVALVAFLHQRIFSWIAHY